jgi:hypothetical protein
MPPTRPSRTTSILASCSALALAAAALTLAGSPAAAATAPAAAVPAATAAATPQSRPAAKVKCVNKRTGFARYSASGTCRTTEKVDRKPCARGGSCVVGDVGPGAGRVFYAARTAQPWGRYLEAAPRTWNSRDGDPNLTWCSDVVTSIAGTQATGLGAGKANTAAMLTTCTTDSAVAVAAYRGGGKADWYLPSRDELRQLFLRKGKVGEFIQHGYWSSSESAPDQAWIQDFYADYTPATTEKGYANYVRPVRAF